jgi:hypothetical protein
MDELTIEFAERITKLEQMMEQSKLDREELKDGMASISVSLSDMKSSLDKYQGFWGGALLVISAVWAFIQLAGDFFMSKLKGEG